MTLNLLVGFLFAFACTVPSQAFKHAIKKSSSSKLTSIPSVTTETPRLQNMFRWSPSGYQSWTWRGNKINYVDMGGDLTKPPLLLIHGFGASGA